MKSLYETLGVSETASQEEIRAAYRRLAAKHHPDKNLGDNAATGKFQEVEEAYRVLKDAAARKAYDETGEAQDSERKKQDKAANLLLGMLAGYFDNTAAQSTYPNFLTYLEAALKQTVDTHNSQADFLRRKKKAAEKQLKKVKRKGGGESLFEPVIERIIQQTAKQLASVEAASEVLAMAKDTLSDYEQEGGSLFSFQVGYQTGGDTYTVKRVVDGG